MLNLQSVSFASLSPSLFENLELQLLVELSCLHGLCSGTASARMNLMFWGECVAVSHRTGVDIYCTSQSQILAQGSSNLTLEVQSAAEFSSNPDQTHLPVIF